MKSDLEVGPAAALKYHLHINAWFLNLITFTVETWLHFTANICFLLLKLNFDCITFHSCIACTEVEDLNMFSAIVLLLAVLW